MSKNDIIYLIIRSLLPFESWKMKKKTFNWGSPNDATINNISKFVYLVYREHGLGSKFFTSLCIVKLLSCLSLYQ
jgi:hypothetical protein